MKRPRKHGNLRGIFNIEYLNCSKHIIISQWGMMQGFTKKRKPDLCNPTLVRLSMSSVYQVFKIESSSEEEK